MKYDLLEYPGTGANLLHGEGGGVSGPPRCTKQPTLRGVRLMDLRASP